ncbi:RimJ/RimL family protein N-acetyltransferase [Rubricella aquisinus]|uniref:RimJ/RimL family protein N-acetyltransferase n=1 Tax=Rubricella aquisinus TaxID=2028108 RepID=A0A840WPB9_9RHOB|nr:GNAT family N-acetyltransferase [Rubricella aquisinus]MBB5515923.1 RimJ/RimL family protein N-acetyltransferase [Rubricella aquisinus]
MALPDDTWAETERLILRRWRDADDAPFAAINADPAVMRHFPAPLTRAESDAFLDRMRSLWRSDLSFAAVERKSDGALIGMTGLHRPVGLPIGPVTEVGWRFARSAWGHGYATEAANASLAVAWDMGLSEVVAFTSPANQPSMRVMERIGMTRAPARDFIHPAMPADHPLNPAIVYAISPAR